MELKDLKKLVKWSLDEFSALPWRMNRSMYTTLVSEIMLQQTNVSTVLNHYENFLIAYPNIYTLAESTEEEICLAWRGLGYYSRARRLRDICIHVVKYFEGVIPSTLEDLQNLKGIGPYTANALIAIGANKKALAIDANLERVLSRYYSGYGEIPKGPKLQKKLLEDFNANKIFFNLDKEKIQFRNINEALMDLGRKYCQATKTQCELCKLNSTCDYYQNYYLKNLNVPLSSTKKISKYLELSLLRVIVSNSKNEIIAYQKSNKQWLSGQFEIPTFVLEAEEPNFFQYPRIKNFNFDHILFFKSCITKYKIKNYVVKMSMGNFKNLLKENNLSFQEMGYDLFENHKKINYSTATFKSLQFDPL